MKNIPCAVGMCMAFLVSSFSLSAKESNKISREEAHKDIDYYFSKVDSLHPNMYWNTPKEEVDNFKQELKEWCEDSVNITELNLRLTESNHFFDYHTHIATEADIEKYYIEKYEDNLFIPIELNEESLFIEDNLKVISINDIPVDSLIEHTKKRYGVDHNPKKVNYLISKSPLFQYTLLEKGILPPYTIKVISPLEKDSIIYNKDGISHAELKKNLEAKWQPTSEEAYKLILHPEQDIAIIQFNKCVGEEELENFDNFLAESFRQLENLNIQNLFIDVTRNKGGDTRACGLFFKYLALDNDLDYKQYAKIKSYTENGTPLITDKVYKMAFPHSPEKGYAGNVFVCYGFYTSSSAPFLVESLKISERGILVGDDLEPQVPVYIDLKSFELPYSGIKGGSSYKYFYKESPELPRNHKGELIPDIKHEFSLQKEIDLQECILILEKAKIKS